MSTQSQLQLPAPINGSNLSALRNLTATTDTLSNHFTTCFEHLIHLAECQATYNESSTVPELELALRELIDVQNDSESLRRAVANVAQEHANFQVPADTAKSILERTEVAKVQYRDLTDAAKYSRNKQFDEFKRRVFAIEHKDEDYPGAESFFKTRNGDEEEELEMTYSTKRSLKCPITMMTFQNPVRSKVCVHVFSKEAIMEMINRNHGMVKCPVAGCPQTIMAASLERDRVTERRVRDEADEESANEGEELSSDADNEDVLDIL